MKKKFTNQSNSDSHINKSSKKWNFGLESLKFYKNRILFFGVLSSVSILAKQILNNDAYFTEKENKESIIPQKSFAGNNLANLREESNYFAPTGTISGTAFLDLNGDGIRTTSAPIEPGVANVTVNIYNTANTIAGTGVTSATGTYSIAASGTGPYRVEFTIPAGTNYLPSPGGAAYGSSIQFVKTDSQAGVNFAVSDPENFSTSQNPRVVIPQHIPGNPLGGGTAGTDATLKSFLYNSAVTTLNSFQNNANASVVGAVWGLAWDKVSKKLFSAAMVRRHSGLGPLGKGGIYVTNFATGTGVSSSFIDLATVPGIDLGTVPDNVTRGLAASSTAQNIRDASVFGLVGKVGLGDMDISYTKKKLYVVNLFERNVIEINIANYLDNGILPTAADVTELAIVGNQSCTNGVARPFALKVYRDKVYIGTTCTGELEAETASAANMNMTVVSYDLNTSTWALPINSTAGTLNYTKGEPQVGGGNVNHPWSDLTDLTQARVDNAAKGWRVASQSNGVVTAYFCSRTTPWLTDIEFDIDGSMILGISDRAGYQWGGWQPHPNTGSPLTELMDFRTGGDTRRFYNNNGVFVGEAAGTTLAGGGCGTSSGFAEYYCGENFGTSHSEISLGALAFLPGSNEIMTTAMDPAANIWANGIIKLNNTTGQKSGSGIEIYTGNVGAASFGKSAGVGDIEILTDAAPIEVGNRIWDDRNKDGIQDANEIGIANVTVEIYSPGPDGVFGNGDDVLVGTTTTNANGDYYFNNTNTIADPRKPVGWTGITTGILPGYDYQIRVPLAQTSLTDGGYYLTPEDANSNGSDLIDSDGVSATTSGGVVNATINFNTTITNHSFDVGFIPTLTSIGSTVFIDNNNNGLQDGADVGIPNITVNLINVGPDGVLGGTDDATAGTMLTDANGNYFFGDLLYGKYVVVIPTTPTGYPLSSTITATTDNDIDGDDNGIQAGGFGTQTVSPVITLKPNTEPLDAAETAQGSGQDNGTTGGATGDVNGNMTVDFGFSPVVSIGSTVFIDLNNDGIQSGAGEIGIANVTLNIINVGPDGVLGGGDDLAPVVRVTDTNGNYFAGNLPPGKYVVVIPTAPSLYPLSSTTTVTTDNNIDGDDNGIQAAINTQTVSPVIELLAGTEPLDATETGQGNTQDNASADDSGNMTIDFGFTATVSIGSTVFIDVNNDGVQAASGEAGIAGIVVNVYNVGADGLFGGGDDVLSGTATTNATGLYFVSGLAPGNYVAVIPTPSTLYPLSSTVTVTTDNQTDRDDNGIQATSGAEVVSPVINLTVGAEPLDAVETGTGNTQDNASGDNKGDMTVDFGFINYVSIGSTIFADNNNNGLQGAGEAGLPGVVVNIINVGADGVLGGTDDVTAGSVTTDANGNYYLGELLPGRYVVVVPTPPAGYNTSSTTTATTDNNTDSNDDGTQASPGAQTTSPVITLTVDGESVAAVETGQGGTQDDASGDNDGNMTIDFGFVPTRLTLGSTVFIDLNNNGVQDSGETGIPSITVTATYLGLDGVLGGGDDVATTDVTDASGLYFIPNLLPGKYIVSIATVPVAYPRSSTFSSTTDDDIDNNDDGSQPGGSGTAVTSPIITLTASTEPLDAVETGSGGNQDTSVAGFTGDDNGNMTIDFGFSPVVSIGSTVFIDVNNDGVQAATGEAGIAGVTVNIYDVGADGVYGGGDDVLVGTDVTDGTGLYFVGGLFPGKYVAVIPTAPTLYPLSSTVTVTTDNQTDRDDNGIQATSGAETVSPVTTLTAGTEPTGTAEGGTGGTQDDAAAIIDANGDMTVDFGFINYVSIGSTIFADNNNNGLQGAGEAGLPGVVVNIINVGADGVLGGTDDVTAGSVTTDANGNYYLGELLPGRYVVVVPTPPAGYNTSSTTTATTDNNTDSNDDGTQASAGAQTTSPVITLTVDGESVAAVETGQGGTQDDASGDNDGNMTIDFGFVPTRLTLGSTVFIDLNNNGVQDSGEAGIPSITVTATYLGLDGVLGGGDDVATTDVTDASGLYFIPNLLPGKYIVSIATVPVAYPRSSTFSSTTDDDIDNNDDGSQPGGSGTAVSSPIITLTASTEPLDAAETGSGGNQDTSVAGFTGDDNGNMTIDFGFSPVVSIGSTVFIDVNNDGVQAATGEAGIAGVTVNIYDVGADGVYGGGDDVLVGTDVTDGTGLYFVGGLFPGKYVAVIPTAPTLYPLSSTVTVTTDNQTDRDDNGIQATSGAETVSPVITLTAGTEPTGTAEGGTGGTQDDAAAIIDANGDMTVDFGFINYVSIGSTIFADNNNNGLQGAGEAGLPGVVVNIINVGADGVLGGTDDVTAGSVTTDANGNYYLGELLPGRYVVVVPTPPAGYNTSSTTTATTDNNTDSNDDGTQASAGAQTTSPVITLTVDGESVAAVETGQGGTQDDASGDNDGNMTIDFGFVPTRLTLGSTVFIDLNNNGVQDSGEAGIPSITVTATYLGLDGVLGGGDDVATTDVTDASGLYFIPNLLPGKYIVSIATVPVAYPRSSTFSSTTDDDIDNNDDGSQPGGSGTAVSSPIITLTASTEPLDAAETGSGGNQDTSVAGFTGDDNGNMTIDFGFSPVVSIGSTVFIDVNNDGVQAATGEAGIAGVTVNIYDVGADGVYGGGDDVLVGTDVTDGTGLYFVGGLFPGKYVAVIPTAPTLYPLSSTVTVTTDNQTDRDDNGIQATSGAETVSPVITLTAGTEPTGTAEGGTGGTQDDAAAIIDANGDMTVDFGFINYVSIGSTIFADNNNNGLQGAGEAGLPGVVVNIINVGADGVLGGTDDVTAGSVTTDANGNYYLGELLPGRYVVVVPTPPAGYNTSSTTTATTDNNTDSNDDGTQASAGAQTTSPVITLTVDGESVAAVETGQGGTQDDASGDNDGNMTIDFGFVPTLVSIGSTVFVDANNNGTQDSGEAGIPNVTVNVINVGPDGILGGGDDSAPVVRNTDTNGDYFAGNLLPGKYVVTIPTAPTAYPLSSTPTATTDNDIDANDDGTQSGGTGTITVSPVITLLGGTEPLNAAETGQGNNQDTATGDNNGNMTIDFGFTAPVSIGSTVFIDANNNGTQDSGENGIPNVTVNVVNVGPDGVLGGGDDSAPVTVTTDTNGNYFVDGLLPGNYVVVIPTAPTGYPLSSTTTSTADNQTDGNDNGIQTGGIGTQTVSPVINLSAGNEPLDATETAGGNTQDNTTGDANGDMTIDFGFVPSMSIGSTVFIDANNNGTQDSGEAGIPGVTINVVNVGPDGVLGGTDDSAPVTVTTDTNGDYFVEDLLPGNYVVVIPTAPTGYPVSSAVTSTADNDTDGDDNGIQTGGSGTQTVSPVIVLAVGLEPTGTAEGSQGGTQDDTGIDNNGNMTIDFGFVPTPVSIGSTVFVDANNNGTQDSGEAGISNVTVNIINVGPDGVLGGTDDSAPIILTTDTNGDYFAGNLLPGKYVVTIPTAPTAYPLSSTPTATTDNDVDGNDDGTQAASGDPTTSPVITLTAGTEPLNAAETGQGNNQDTATGDDNGNMTIDFGFTAPVSIGSTVFIDANNNGTQDSGENGIPNVTVNVVNVGPDGVLGGGDDSAPVTVTTDTNGNYFVDGLLPGNYVVVIPTAPTGYPLSSTTTSTADNQTDGNDNGIQTGGIGTQTVSPVINLSAGNEPLDATETAGGNTQDNTTGDANGDMTIDFGFVPSMSIGSTVFIDTNNNGTQDSGEAGIPNVTVNVVNVGPDGVLGGTDDSAPITVTTDTNGDYFVEDLLPGNYVVVIPTAPTGYPVSSAVTSTADDDTDGDDNGIQTGGSGTQTVSPVIVLAVGLEPTGTAEGSQGGTQDDTGIDNNGNMTIDFGFVPTPVSIGSTVFVDANNNGTQDSGEAGIPNVTVNVINVGPDGVLGGTDDSAPIILTTDTNGDYFAGNLLPGKYVVTIPTAPAAYPLSSTPTATTDNDVDGNDDGTQAASGDPTTSPVITLTAGTEPLNAAETGQGNNQDTATGDDNGNMTIDFGFTAPVSIGSTVFIDANNNGTQDSGENGIPNVTVNVVNVGPDGVLGGGDDSAPVTVTTDTNGNYFVDGLLPGNYVVVIPTAPTGYPLSSTTTSTADNQTDGNDDGIQTGGIGTQTVSPVINLSAGNEPLDATETAGGNTQDNTTGDANGDMTIDFGFVPSMSIGSTVFIDANNNGTQDSGEAGIPGVTINVVNVGPDGVLGGTDDSAPVTVTTDTNGDYFVEDLLPGNYVVVIPTAPTGYPVSSAVTSTADNDTDGDDNGIQTGGSGTQTVSPVIVLAVGLEPTGTAEGSQGGTQDDTGIDNNGNMTIDFGFVPTPVSIGSTVFVDANNNGTQDSGEAGISNVTVNIINVGPDGVLGGTDDSAPIILTTDTNGDYFAGNLLPGKYVVTIPTAPTAYPLSSTPTATTDNDVDGNDDGTQAASGDPTTSPVITLTAGTEPLNAAETGQGNNQDTATGDDNGNMTIDFGFTAPVSIGSTVFIDANNNGTQDSGENGIPNVTVNVVNVGPDGVLGGGDDSAPVTVTTDTNGNYFVDGLLPGNYVVVIPTAPTGYPLSSTTTSTADNQTDGNDNGIQTGGIGTQTVSPVINLSAGNEPLDATETAGGNTQDNTTGDANGDMTIDFGFVPSMSIGSTVFIDTNNNGTQDSGEAGIPNVTVNVVNVGPDGVLGGTDDSAPITVTTDTNGDYFVEDLLPGNYVVVIPTAPTGYPVSSAVTSTADDDTDGDDNGIQTGGSGTQTVSPVIVLAVGLEPTGTAEGSQGGTQDDTGIDNNGNMTIDFGFVPSVGVNVSGNVFVDTNGSAAVDGAQYVAPAASLYAILVDAMGNIAGSAEIQPNGTYSIPNVAPGTYTMLLSTTAPGANGTTAPTAASIPPGYFNISQGIGTTPDGTNDGIQSTPIVVSTADVPLINFGINTSAPLPINLVSFNGKQVDDQINLKWKTVNEKNFSHFEVQVSNNAKEFGTFATVKGNKSGIYSQADTNPKEGVNYYRLKMVDVDGTSKLSNVITVNFETGANFITVENPANNGEFKVMTNLKNPRFTLLNTLGQVVDMSITEIGSNNFVIKSNSVAGVYYLNIVSNNKVVTRKVIMP